MRDIKIPVLGEKKKKKKAFWVGIQKTRIADKPNTFFPAVSGSSMSALATYYRKNPSYCIKEKLMLH